MGVPCLRFVLETVNGISTWLAVTCTCGCRAGLTYEYGSIFVIYIAIVFTLVYEREIGI